MRSLLLVAALVSAPGCLSLESQECTTEFRSYDIKLTRTLDVAATDVDRTTMQACIDDACVVVAAPAADGRAKFGALGNPPSGELALSQATDGKQIVSAKFSVGERNGAVRLRVIVRDSMARMHTAEGTTTFGGGSCHPAPANTDV